MGPGRSLGRIQDRDKYRALGGPRPRPSAPSACPRHCLSGQPGPAWAGLGRAAHCMGAARALSIQHRLPRLFAADVRAAGVLAGRTGRGKAPPRPARGARESPALALLPRLRHRVGGPAAPLCPAGRGGGGCFRPSPEARCKSTGGSRPPRH